jgi:hypothetical protein
MSKVVMSEEQFERLLAAVRSYPHVCMPCTRPHLYQWTPPYWYYNTQTYNTTPSITTTTTSQKVEG